MFLFFIVLNSVLSPIHCGKFFLSRKGLCIQILIKTRLNLSRYININTGKEYDLLVIYIFCYKIFSYLAEYYFSKNI